MTERQAWLKLADGARRAAKNGCWFFLCNEINVSTTFDDCRDVMLARIKKEFKRRRRLEGMALWDWTAAGHKHREAFCRKQAVIAAAETRKARARKSSTRSR